MLKTISVLIQCWFVSRALCWFYMPPPPRAAKEGVQGTQLRPHPKTLECKHIFCTPKNFEGALHRGRSESHQFSLKVWDLATGRQFDSVECSHGRWASHEAHFWVFLLIRGTFHRWRGPLLLQIGWLAVCQRGPPPVRWALPYDKDGPPSVDHGPSVGQRGPPSIRGDPRSVRGGPSFIRGDPLPVRLALRRSKIFSWSEGFQDRSS